MRSNNKSTTASVTLVSVPALNQQYYHKHNNNNSKNNIVATIIAEMKLMRSYLPQIKKLQFGYQYYTTTYVKV